MKTAIFGGLGLLILASLPALAAPGNYVGMLPGEKVAIQVEDDERNPFGQRIVQVAEAAPKDAGAEESDIRAIVEGLTVKGVTKSGARVQVFLGSFALEEGKFMPQLIAGQTEKLKVLAVNEEKMELGFVEKDGSAESRKIVLPLNFTPSVRYKVGPGASASATAAELGGVYKKNAPATPKE